MADPHILRKKRMKKFKVIDGRDHYRNNPKFIVRQDNEKLFSVNEIDDDNNIVKMIMLNPNKFQNERIVDEKEATWLMLKGIKVVEIA